MPACASGLCMRVSVRACNPTAHVCLCVLVCCSWCVCVCCYVAFVYIYFCVCLSVAMWTVCVCLLLYMSVFVKDYAVCFTRVCVPNCLCVLCATPHTHRSVCGECVRGCACVCAHSRMRMDDDSVAVESCMEATMGTTAIRRSVSSGLLHV